MRAAACAALALAAACGVPRDAGFSDVKSALQQHTRAPIRWQHGGSEDAQALKRVDELLKKDLTAESALEIALVNNAKLQATYERLGLAQADVVQAGLVRNPTLSGGVGVPLTSAVSIAYDLTFVQDFLDLVLMPLRKRFARAEFERVKLEVGDDVLALIAEVREAFYGVLGAQQVLEMRRLVFDASQASAELSARQHLAGNLSDLDLAMQQGMYADTKLDVARADFQVAVARERLSRLLGVWGRAVAWKASGQLDAMPAEEPALDHLESFAIAHRLDLAAARQEVNIFASALSLTKGSRVLPSVGVGIRLDHDAEGNTTLGPQLSLELPIFDQKQAQLARLRAQLRAAERRRDGLAIEIRSQVREGRLRLLSSRATVEYYRTTLIPLREQTLVLLQQQVNAMLLGVYQLIQAKQAEINTYRDYIEVVRDYWIARANLERIAGAELPIVAHMAPAIPPKGANR